MKNKAGDMIMPFDYGIFIKPNIPFVREYRKENSAPMFRKKIVLPKVEKAILTVCGLGFAYYYINGAAVSPDLFTAPVSNYTKTLWYHAYDVSHLLQEGENTFAVICGNGWYNESMQSDWFYHEAPWRDVPKFILKLETDGKTVLISDETWKCAPKSAIYFNELRNGEYFDARLYDESWTKAEFDDSDWDHAVRDVFPPAGVFRKCECEPIREMKEYIPVSVTKVGAKKYLYDIGQNIAGYVRIKTKGRCGVMLTIRYAETVTEDLKLYLGDIPRPYQEGEMQTDRLILSGEAITWSPRFAYHGFRYIEIDGIEDAENIQISGIFVHQDVKRKTAFSCSDSFLNALFEAGVMSVYSNMFYQLTDCPTREKLGWANDAQASCDQILTNFHSVEFFKKWYRDILDAQMPDGAMPGIIPTSGWGYEWGNGPVSDGVLFEIPYRVYLHSGNDTLLKDGFSHMKRYLAYLKRREKEDGFVSFGLDDWSAPNLRVTTPVELINAVLTVWFYKVAALAASRLRISEDFSDDINRIRNLLIKTYINADGTCRVQEQTAVALLIYFDIYEELQPLAEQLKKLVEEKDFHHDCGMVGIRRLLHALNKCGLQEYAYKILTAEGNPGYKEWFDSGATTLWERWQGEHNPDSKNHHMYSDFMAWMIQTICGIRVDESRPGECIYHLEPYRFENISEVNGMYETPQGKIEVSLYNGKMSVNIEDGVTVFYRGKQLAFGETIIAL